MSELPYLIKDLALILVVAGVVTIVFKRLKQPLVLGYVVAGFLVGPHMPYTMSVVDRADIQTWADIGVMFLLFSLGLDFSFKKILRMGSSPVIATCSVVFCMIVLGISAGKLFGWSRMDCIFLGGMLAMSSTTIIYKAFDDLDLRRQRFADLVMSVLILEDMLAIVMMVMLTAIAGGGGGGGAMLGSVLKIVFFLVLWFVVGIFAIPLLLRSTRRFVNNETLLIVALGLCCAMAVVSTQAGFSSAFGAFVMGSILAETVEAERITRLVEPVKNLFGAVFFVSVGMLVDPAVLVRYALPICLLVVTIIVGQAVLGSFGFLISGQSLRSAMRCGFSMAQIGEFSFIIASLGLSLGVTSDFLYPVVVAVSVITTFLTPYMIRASQPAYNLLERRLPGRWIAVLNDLTLSRPPSTGTGRWGRLLWPMARVTVVYVILSVAVTAVMLSPVLSLLRDVMPRAWADGVCLVLTALIMAPFLRGIVTTKNSSREFRALWADGGANRLPLLVTIGVRLIIAVALLFNVCYRLTHFAGALLICVAAVAVTAMLFSRHLRRRSMELERLFMLNLRSREIKAEVSGERKPVYERHLLDRDIHIADYDVPAASLWAGRSLRELRLSNKYGIHISSILRGTRRINIPDGDSVIFPADKIQVIGTDEQIAAFGAAINSEVHADDPDIERRQTRLVQVTIGKGSPLAGLTIGQSGIRSRYGCMVAGIEEGRETLTAATASRLLRRGDVLWIVGEPASIASLLPVARGEAQPADTQPADTQPAEAQPAETQPADTQPAETQPEDTP